MAGVVAALAVSSWFRFRLDVDGYLRLGLRDPGAGRALDEWLEAEGMGGEPIVELRWSGGARTVAALCHVVDADGLPLVDRSEPMTGWRWFAVSAPPPIDAELVDSVMARVHAGTRTFGGAVYVGSQSEPSCPLGAGGAVASGGPMRASELDREARIRAATCRLVDELVRFGHDRGRLDGLGYERLVKLKDSTIRHLMEAPGSSRS